MIKSILDKIISFILIIVISPLFLIISLCVFLFMGLPIFFKQNRPGFKQKLFVIYKFRTLKNSKNLSLLYPDENKIPLLGKWLRKTSLDEIPQLINILKGEMTFVGPRPLLVEHLNMMTIEEKKRHNVKPGITGWAQIHGRNKLSWEQRNAYDLWYIKNHSFCLDLKIVWRTFFIIFNQDEIVYSEDIKK